MHKVIIFIFILFSAKLAGQTSVAKDSTLLYKVDLDEAIDSIKPIEVSFDDLVKKPKKYDGKLIYLKGFLHLELPNSRVYKSQNEFLKNKKRESMLFYLQREEISNRMFKVNDINISVIGFFLYKKDMEYFGILHGIQSAYKF